MMDWFASDGKLINLEARNKFYGTNLSQLENETLFSKTELRALFNQIKQKNKTETQTRNYFTQMGNRLNRKIKKVIASYHLFVDIIISLAGHEEDCSLYPEPIAKKISEVIEYVIFFHRELYAKIIKYGKKFQVGEKDLTKEDREFWKSLKREYEED